MPNVNANHCSITAVSCPQGHGCNLRKRKGHESIIFKGENKNLHEHALCFNLPHHTAKNYAACTRHWVLKLTSAASEITLKNHQSRLLETKEIVSKNSKEKCAKKHETTQS